MEKIAHSWELVVTPALYQGIQSLLTSKNLEALRLVLAEPLKGFDNLEWPPLFYKLRIAREQERVSNLLEPRLERLEQEVQEIPVFGNIYPPVPMEKNFINLSLVCGEPFEDFRGITDGDTPRRGVPGKGDRESKLFSQLDVLDSSFTFGSTSRSNKKLLRGAPRRGGPINGGGFLEKSPPLLTEITVSQLYEHFSSGVILGLPGAGKTTILRYLAFRVFQANNTTGNQPRVVLFVPCRDVPLYDSWYKKRFAVEPSAPTIGEVLEFMTWVFLEGKSDPGDLIPARWVEFQETGKRVKQAFQEGRVWLLVDALDEASGIETRERIKQLFVILFEHLGENRLFLTSRPLERIHLDQAFKTCRVPVFKVVSLTMEQVRVVAKHIMAEDSAVYKKFDTAVWQEEVVIKMAATPITAVLIVAYFQAYEKFDHRFPMYDLLVKFILLKVWDNIKTGAFPYRNMELFFQEIREPGFFNKHKETRILYDALASLCFQLFYESTDGTVQRSVNEDALLGHFSRFIRDRLYYYDEEMARAEALQWRERFRRDYLLLQAGKQEYVFVHSTVMDIVRGNYPSVHWIYLYLKELVSSPGIEKLEQAKEQVDLPLRLCRPVLLEEYLDYGALLEGDSQLAELRQGLLAKLVQKEPLQQWLKGHKEKEEKSFLEEGPVDENLSMKVEQVLGLDTRGYHPEDKNFAYYKDLIGPELAGFFGSPNMKHSGAVWGCAFAPDGKTFVSASQDGTLKLWDAASGKEMRTFTGHKDYVLGCAFSPDGTRLVSASEDQTLKLWDAARGQCLKTLNIPWIPLFTAFSTLHPHQVFTANANGTLTLFDLP